METRAIAAESVVLVAADSTTGRATMSDTGQTHSVGDSCPGGHLEPMSDTPGAVERWVDEHWTGRMTGDRNALVNGNYPLEEGTLVRYVGGVLEVIPMYFREPADALGCVAFLYAGKPRTTRPEPDPYGTCFFAKAKGISTGIDYLITARHVLDDLIAEGRGASVRLNVPGGGVAFQSVSLDRTAWVFHPDGAVDVAMHPWRGGALSSYEIGFVNIDDMLSHIENPRAPARIGDDAAFFGLMVNFAGKKKNLLALRVGAVSLITDELIRGPRGDSNYHIVDAQSYKGNSGAPVWAISGASFRFWGVLVSAWPEKAELFQIRATRTKEEYYNLGVTWVTPMEKVVDILNLDSEKKRRKEACDKYGVPVPLSAAKFTRADMESALKKVSRKAKPSKPAPRKKRT